MKPSRIDHRRTSLGLRAPRLAVLIGSDCNWGHCLALVRALTETWGGATFAVLPTDGQSLSPLFWKLLKLHDPDWMMVFGDTVHVSEELKQELLRRHSVALPWGKHIWHLWPDNIGYPLTGVYNALPEGGLPSKISDLWVEADGLVQLMIQATTGSLSDDTKKKLRERGVDTLDQTLTFGDSSAGLFNVTTDIWEPASTMPHAYYSFALSSLHLGLYVRPVGSIDQHALLVVCGSTIEDFAYFWTLRALRALPLRSNVYWVPLVDESLIEANRDYKSLWPWLGHAITESLKYVWGDKRVLVTSASVKPEQLSELGRALYEANPVRTFSGFVGEESSHVEEPTSVPAEVVAPDDFEQLLPYTVAHWEMENTPDTNSSIVQFLDGEGMAVLDTPTPSSVAFNYGSDMRWIIEAIVEGLRVPARPALTNLLVSPTTFANCRVTRFGSAFTAVSDLKLAGAATRSLLARPRLRLPTDWEVFAALCKGEGLTIAPSDKGQYELEALRLFGGLEPFSNELADSRFRSAIFKFLDESPNQEGVTDQGAKVGGRRGRILDITALTKIWDGDDKAATRFVNLYLERRIIHRGLLVIKCPHCRRADWYRFAELSDSVTCHRCSREYVVPAEAETYFKLDEIVAEALSAGSYISLLALDILRRRSSDGFLYATACDVYRGDAQAGKPWCEVDFFALADGKFIVGECKRGRKLKVREQAQLKRYVILCGLLRPDEFLVATDDAKFSDATAAFLDEIETDLQKLDVRLARVTGSDIGWPPGVSS